jgi:hypothetical protein
VLAWTEVYVGVIKKFVLAMIRVKRIKIGSKFYHFYLVYKNPNKFVKGSEVETLLSDLTI